jgi:hypothetical protein
MATYQTRHLEATREISHGDKFIRAGETFHASEVDAEHYLSRGHAKVVTAPAPPPAAPRAHRGREDDAHRACRRRASRARRPSSLRAPEPPPAETPTPGTYRADQARRRSASGRSAPPAEG